jgi:hypothetical protein
VLVGLPQRVGGLAISYEFIWIVRLSGSAAMCGSVQQCDQQFVASVRTEVCTQCVWQCLVVHVVRSVWQCAAVRQCNSLQQCGSVQQCGSSWQCVTVRAAVCGTIARDSARQCVSVC